MSPHYDSLLGKLMVWAPTRAEACDKMAKALAVTKLQGTPNNLEFLRVGSCSGRLCLLLGHSWSALSEPRQLPCIICSLRCRQQLCQSRPPPLTTAQALVADPRFRAGDTTTRFLEGFSFVPHVAEVSAAPVRQGSTAVLPTVLLAAAPAAAHRLCPHVHLNLHLLTAPTGANQHPN